LNTTGIEAVSDPVFVDANNVTEMDEGEVETRLLALGVPLNTYVRPFWAPDKPDGRSPLNENVTDVEVTG
jgi:hypothetical protein